MTCVAGAIPQPMEEVREREGERGGEGEVVEEDFEYEEEFEVSCLLLMGYWSFLC